MHKLSLETLNLDRLRSAVDQDTINLGQALLSQGQVSVVELSDLVAHCEVKDKRLYPVLIKVTRSHIYFKCVCPHAKRGLICEHDVAAWLALREKLQHQFPSVWRSHLEKVIDTTSNSSSRSAAKPYLLIFSLQGDYSPGTPMWRIIPYTLSLNSLPDGLSQAFYHSPTDQIDMLVEEKASDLIIHLRHVNHPLNPEACLNSPRQSVSLANIILESERAHTYSARFPFQDYFSLLTEANSTIFLGTASNPLIKRLQLLNGPGEIHLFLNREHDGLHITPRLAVDDQILDSSSDDLKLIVSDPPWILVDRYLLELTNPIGLDLFGAFLEAPALVIPTEQESEFLEKYYLDLARRFPVEGNIVAWEDISEDPVPRLYLSDVNGELQVQLRFGYGQLEVSYDANLPQASIRRMPDSWTLVKIHRASQLEKAAFDLVATSSFGLKKAPMPARPGLFRLRARTHPVDFLLNSVPRLSKEGFETYGEEQLKTARVNRHTPTINFNVSSGIDWFDIKTVVNFGEVEVALKDLRRVMRKHERFVKLSDGSIGEIPQEWFERYKHFFEFGETTGESLRFSRHHISLVDEALENADQLVADVEFERRRQKFHHLISSGFSGINEFQLPPGFRGELRPYQKAGYDWMHFLRDLEFGGCLADDMGLGKTIQALAFFSSLYGRSSIRPAPIQASLLVVPRSLLVNWQREAARFTPELRILEYFDTNRQKEATSFDNFDLVITTYGVMLRDIQFLHSYTFFYAVLDESQAIKNPLSQTARAAHLLRSLHKLVLTGTPIENSTAELWSQFTFLNPGLLGSLKYFKSEFGTPIEKKNDEETARTLRRLIYPFILRRTKDLVAPELPPRSDRVLYCDMEPAQRHLYNRTRDGYRGVLLGMLEKDGIHANRMKILEGLLRLRQISIHPLLVDEKFRGESGKYQLLLDTLETLRAEHHKALVFSQFVSMLNILRRSLDARGMAYTYLDGQTQNRQGQVDLFQSDPSIPFFLISLKAGGLGLNLTAADYVIHIDPWWNPAVEMQASDRTHRIGQDKPVFIFKLIVRDSVEEKIMLLQERKRNLVDQVITTESVFFKNLTAEDVAELFS